MLSARAPIAPRRAALAAALALTSACALPHADLRTAPGSADGGLPDDAPQPSMDALAPRPDAFVPPMDTVVSPPADAPAPPVDRPVIPADVPVDRPVIPADSSPCAAGLTLCGAACVNTTGDSNHCGRCDNRCPAPMSGSAACAAGVCAAMCPAGQRLCGDACKTNDADACGAMCVRCAAPMGGSVSCNGTACVPACPAGSMLSGNACVGISTGACGNGMLDPMESCDDGNRTAGDGCNAGCFTESGVFRDQCSQSATGVSLRSGQTIWIRDTTVGRAPDGAGTCGLSGPDMVFRIRAVDGGDLNVVATPIGMWDLGLRANGPCPGDRCIDMANSGRAETFGGRVSGGSDYDVVVDGYGGAAGAFTLQVTLR